MIQITKGDYGFNLVFDVVENETSIDLGEANSIEFKASNVNKSHVVTGEAFPQDDKFTYLLKEGDFPERGVYFVQLIFSFIEPESEEETLTKKITVPSGLIKVIN
jgi:hypothetical protein